MFYFKNMDIGCYSESRENLLIVYASVDNRGANKAVHRQ